MDSWHACMHATHIHQVGFDLKSWSHVLSLTPQHHHDTSSGMAVKKPLFGSTTSKAQGFFFYSGASGEVGGDVLSTKVRSEAGF